MRQHGSVALTQRRILSCFGSNAKKSSKRWVASNGGRRRSTEKNRSSNCSGGTPTRTDRRIGQIRFSREALALAQRLVDAGAVPRRAAPDAAHVAIAAVHNVEFLATWNFRHIANATARPRIETVCRDSGIEPPVLCTPEELTETEEVDDGG
jgi:hypothetical protein